MFKKIELWFLILILIIFFIVFIFFGAILKHHYSGGQKFKVLQKIGVFLAEIPSNTKYLIKNKIITSDVLLSTSETPLKNKESFSSYSDPNREELILVSRHDGDLKRSIVEIRDMNNFQVLHTFLPDINEIHSKTDLTKEEFTFLERDRGPNRYHMWNPAINSNGELIFASSSPLVKVDFCGNILWVNDVDNYSHSINLDLNEKIYVKSIKFPFTESLKPIIGDSIKNFQDDTINILNQDGEIEFSKSLAEILIENGLINRVFTQDKYSRDPLHLNDIQPVLYDGNYMKKGDLLLSVRNISLIILYRPSNNKILKIIEGEFLNQHDVDIINDSTISIYNNNLLRGVNKRKIIDNNEIVFYHFDTNTFSKKFEKTFVEFEINTATHGLVDFLEDGSAIVEDRNNSRIFYLDSKGKPIWIYYNISSQNLKYDLWWSRIIQGEKLKKIKKMINNKDKLCKN